MSDNAPHSLVFWIRCEVQDRLANGQISGIVRDKKGYQGVIHCYNRAEANQILEKFANLLSEDIKECQAELNQG